MEQIEERVKRYWTLRSHDFSSVRRRELEEEVSKRWLTEIRKYLPDNKPLKILDVGTGAGFFAVLLSMEGHKVWGVDITPAMIEEAKRLSKDLSLTISFEVMDAQNLVFPDEAFDVVISRNLTWTLPEPEKAYKEWIRVLKKGGILLNFDADYGQDVLNSEPEQEEDWVGSGCHIGMTKELLLESNQITKSMEISQNKRPNWDLNVLQSMVNCKISCDQEAGARILRENNGEKTPTFLIAVEKAGG
ncbi:class I SAM-dependent methyltransferase [Lacrimispora algidixylanolytica]|uniref:class I SAM-dependent methyltransferase n=1 Tax=Lacrimispora algidixylanolytica TaxID=94868 RepID=UPI0013141A31|nr:class I SAM-dependent methyltransferase [Lacrimispora algidixylanolytica]